MSYVAAGGDVEREAALCRTGLAALCLMLSLPVTLLRTTPRQYRELRRCVKVEVAVLGSQSLISLMVSVDVKQH